nr:pro-interleukin-16-like [Nerophis lumbriciformis]
MGSIETMSLDRATSRNTRAKQIRSARAAHPHTLSEKTSFFELPEVNRISGAQRGRTMPNKGKLTEELELRLYEDVFEPNLNNGVKSAGWKTQSETHSPLVSVRNKINQFEALTQKSQGFGKNTIPRRAFSVPTRLNTAHDCLKSESEKASGMIGEKCIGLRDLKETSRIVNEEAGQPKCQSQRTFSVDEIGQRFGSDLTKREGANMDTIYKYTDDSSNYSSLKNTVESPLKEVALHHENLYIDEPDYCQVTNGQNQRMNNSESSMLLRSSDPEPRPYADLSGTNKAKPSVIILTVTDDDKTPTNSPSRSPPSSPVSLLDSTSPITPTENTQTAETPEPYLSTCADPLTTTSQRQLFPDVTDGESKGKKHMLDLDAWVAGWKAWKQDDALEDDEDDDDHTQKGDDSDDSDSGESSVTITSNMSLSDRRSFSLSLAELCYFTGADSESENDSDESPLTGRRSASLSSEVSALSYVSVLPSEELDKLLEDVRSLGDCNLQKDVHVVVLHKEMAVGLGFSIAGGVDQNKPVVVHKVFPTGVAAQEGSIREGDQVLSINGTALGGHTHWEALRVLRRAKTREMGVVVLRRGDMTNISKGKEGQTEKSTLTQTSETGQYIRVLLEKKSRDLGFSLEGGVGLGDKPLTIQKIFQGGPVDKISPGDEVMEIEGMSLVGMRRLEAWTMIRRLPSGPVDVVIRRPLKTSET